MMHILILGIVPVMYLGAFLIIVTGMTVKKDFLTKIGTKAAAVGFLLHTAGLVMRWVESYQIGAGHAPTTNLYESLVVFIWCLVLYDLLFGYIRGGKLLHFIILPAAALGLFFASLSGSIDRGIQPLLPELQNNWLPLHVICCLLGYAGFATAAAFACLFLVKKREDDFSILSALPGTNELISLITRSMAAGYIFFSAGIAVGAVAAHFSWGAYWNWDPKQTWALVTWLIYSAALHLYTDTRRGRTALAYLTIAGFAAAVFTYVGVESLPSLHHYF